MQRIANLAMVGCPYIKLRLAQRHNVVHRHIWSGLCWTTTGHHLNQPATPEWWLHMRLQGCDTRGFMPEETQQGCVRSPKSLQAKHC